MAQWYSTFLPHIEPWAWVPTFLKQTAHKETSGEESSHHHDLLTDAQGMGVFIQFWGHRALMWNCGEELQMGLRTWLYFLDKKPWAHHLLSPASVWSWVKWESCLLSPTGFIKQSKHHHKKKTCCVWGGGKGDGNFPKDSFVVLKLLSTKIDRKKMKIILLKFLCYWIWNQVTKNFDGDIFWIGKVLSIKN